MLAPRMILARNNFGKTMNHKLVAICSQLLCGLSLATLLTVPATAQTLSWIRQLGTSAPDYSLGVATDTQGNVVISGYTFSGSLGGQNQGLADAWVAKYNTTGKLLWLRQLGTPKQDYAYGVATDTNGNVFISGTTEGALAGVYKGGGDAWVAKFDAGGKLLWKRQLGGTKTSNNSTSDNSTIDSSRGVATDTQGNVYISGSTTGGLAGANRENGDAWVAKYDTTGKLLWVRQLGSSGDVSNAVATDVKGNVYISGTTFGTVAGTNQGLNDAWVAKYNTTGKLLWVRQMGTPKSDESYGVATDVKGNVYISGTTFGTVAGTRRELDVAWVAKYDTTGKLLWKQQLGSFASISSRSVATDTSGDVYISGKTYGVLPGTNQGIDDALIAKYDTTGKLLWLRQFGSSDFDYSRGIATDTIGNLYISGYIEDLEGDYDAWVAKFTQTPTK